jgi:hypothetical protein
LSDAGQVTRELAFQLGWFGPVLAQVAESGAGVLTLTSDV